MGVGAGGGDEKRQASIYSHVDSSQLLVKWIRDVDITEVSLESSWKNALLPGQHSSFSTQRRGSWKSYNT